MKSVLVTGATGFIGRHTLKPLIDRHYQIHAIYSSGTPIIKHDQICWHPINLHDAASVNHLLQEIKPTHLLHLAWYTKPNEYWTSLKNLDWLNSSLHLLNAFIKSNGKRVVFVGTCAEYDWQQGHCQEFLTPCLPQTLYGVAKYSLYSLSEAIAKQTGLSLAWGRLFYLFGAHEHPQRLIPSAINSLLGKNNFEVMNGRQIRDFMYVKEVADALVALLDSDVTGPVNIASGKAVAIQELISVIAEKLQASQLLTVRDVAETAPKNGGVVSADVTRLRTEVKWSPSYSLETALNETISWWSERA